MELGSIFLILAVLVIVGMYLYAPFMTRARKTSTNQTHEVSALKAERDRVINALQELDFDCGKPVLVADHFCPSCGKSLK
ncbi:MAG: hypothetical protein IPJ47_17300 [Anaerolineales bacterium]|nr:hypothetical protein [Anaerolineales bacterium]